jgi:hypothetical protein
MSQLTMIVLDGEYSLCRLPAGSSLPTWVSTSAFYNISHTSDELSVVCESKYVPETIQQDANWKLLKIAAVLDLSLTGITAKFSTALANAGVNLCVIATFDTDYIMVKSIKLPTAMAALEQAGFIFEPSTITK